MYKKFSIFALVLSSAVLSGCGGADVVGPGVNIINLINSAGSNQIYADNAGTAQPNMTLAADGSSITVDALRIRTTTGSMAVLPSAGDETISAFAADRVPLVFTSSTRPVVTGFGTYYSITSSPIVINTSGLFSGTTSPFCVDGVCPVSNRVVYTDTLALGGRRLGLTYADFGYWASVMRNNANGALMAQATTPFLVYDTANITDLTGQTGGATFNGNIIGNVYDNKGNVSDITGTVRLNVNFVQEGLWATVNLNSGGPFSTMQIGSNTNATTLVPINMATGSYSKTTLGNVTVDGAAATDVINTTGLNFQGVFLGDAGSNIPRNTVGTLTVNFQNNQMMTAAFGAR